MYDWIAIFRLTGGTNAQNLERRVSMYTDRTRFLVGYRGPMRRSVYCCTLGKIFYARPVRHAKRSLLYHKLPRSMPWAQHYVVVCGWALARECLPFSGARLAELPAKDAKRPRQHDATSSGCASARHLLFRPLGPMSPLAT